MLRHVYNPASLGFHAAWLRTIWLGVLVLLSLVMSSGVASALIKFDFEQKYYIHPDRQVWDFCMIRSEGTYHIFYHSILESTPTAAFADTIWVAKSEDLKHWNTPSPILVTGPDWWDGEAMWAPDVIWDQRNQRWTMAYTGVDSLMVQRACLAHSTDLVTWNKEPSNPVFQPDSQVYYWNPTQQWSSFRDPFLYNQGGVWNMLSTAAYRMGGYPGEPLGIIHICRSTDLLTWTDAGIFWANNGNNPDHVLESCQYHVRDLWHHLYFAEYDVYGVSHVSSQTFGGWNMADRTIIDWGGAPEIKQFDPGVDLFARLATYQRNQTGYISYVVRFDTLTYPADGSIPDVLSVHPLDENWVEHVGTSALGNPTFGDNTFERGEEPCGLVGNGWFGSREYYQGPLSGRGSPGTTLGDFATGHLKSRVFRVTGNFIEFLIGGGYYPETCFIALVNAANDSILLKTTGTGQETMALRAWNVQPYLGQEVYIYIVDDEQGDMGHINLDEITEVINPPASLPREAASLVSRHGASPNPTNPATSIHYELNRPGSVKVTVHDLRGRLIWQTPPTRQPVGPHAIIWRGTDSQDRLVPAGVYLYGIQVDGHLAGRGKIAVVK